MQRETNPENFRKLRRFNILMALAYFLEATFVTIGVFAIENIKNYTVRLYFVFTEYTEYIDYLGNPHPDMDTMVSTSNVAWQAPIGVFIVLILLFGLIKHIAVATPKLNIAYNNALQKGVNKFKWIEHAVTYSLMFLIVGVLVGIQAFDTIIIMVLFSLAVSACGLFMEQVNQTREKHNFTPAIFGIVFNLIVWLIIITYMLLVQNPVSLNIFDYIIIGTTFIGTNLIFVNLIQEYRQKGKYEEFLYGEQAHMILNIIIKSVFVITMFIKFMTM